MQHWLKGKSKILMIAVVVIAAIAAVGIIATVQNGKKVDKKSSEEQAETEELKQKEAAAKETEKIEQEKAAEADRQEESARQEELENQEDIAKQEVVSNEEEFAKQAEIARQEEIAKIEELTRQKEAAQASENKAQGLETSQSHNSPNAGDQSGNGHTVVIDAGHQAKGNNEKEPIGPGASTTKPKVASGTSGSVSGLKEYELNLQVSLKLRDELRSRGYQVIMIRETHDVNISNAERAQAANESGAEIFLRIHANGDDNSSVSGALTMAPSEGNEFVSRISKECQKLSEVILDDFCAATGAKSRGVLITDSMSGINWCTIPVTIVEMGFMSNPEDDTNMASDAYQGKMVQGIANGVDRYFQ